jgi:hypothetical protein
MEGRRYPIGVMTPSPPAYRQAGALSPAFAETLRAGRRQERGEKRSISMSIFEGIQVLNE